MSTISTMSCVSCRRPAHGRVWQACPVNPRHVSCSVCWGMWILGWNKPSEEDEGHFPIIPCPCDGCNVDCIREEYRQCRASIITLVGGPAEEPRLTYGLTCFTADQMIVQTRVYLKEKVSEGYQVESVSIYDPGHRDSTARYRLDAATIRYLLSRRPTYVQHGEDVFREEMRGLHRRYV